LAIVLSLIPFTAPAAISLRVGFGVVPVWQILTSIVVLALAAVGAVWVAARAFRLGMLRYGQKVQWREIFGLNKKA
ncbi:MAG: hypothetical protein JXB38_13530, partial [Anaerolineales bacterium]|nr:hypothetical protein [Anaerolineales bacterium]